MAIAPRSASMIEPARGGCGNGGDPLNWPRTAAADPPYGDPVGTPEDGAPGSVSGPGSPFAADIEAEDSSLPARGSVLLRA